MKSRMEKHYSELPLERTKKNKSLYESVSREDLVLNESVKLLDNENIIDINKIKEMVQSREEYMKKKKYNEIIPSRKEEEEPTNYDIYDDIESRIFDINTILENARKHRNTNSETSKKLRNTQYDILNQLNLNAKIEEEEMDQDFLNQEGNIDGLFEQLMGSEHTVKTKPIEEEVKSVKIEEDNMFYTSVTSFTKDDFDELKDLKKTVKRNNVLIRALIAVLIIAMLTISGVVVYNIFIK